MYVQHLVNICRLVFRLYDQVNSKIWTSDTVQLGKEDSFRFHLKEFIGFINVSKN